jgi:glycogen operon protein
MAIWPGRPYPLGATWDGEGVNFAIFSEHATAVELALFASLDAPLEYARIPLPERTAFVWHGYLPGLRPGQLYGYRVQGAYSPWRGLRFNPHKLLVDPYARAIAKHVRWDDAMFGFRVGSHDDSLPDERDSAPFAPRSVVIDNHFYWGADLPPDTPLHRSVIYELHVKGFTRLHPAVPPELRGTYAGLAHPAVIDYLTSLGVTAVELLPVHQKVHDRRLVNLGLANYWGYNTLGFFAPEIDYSSSGTLGGQVVEFKQMVKALHAAGIEVILDVVYNHTAESDQWGPTLSFKGIDNLAYYLLRPDDLRAYIDFTGTGNSLNMRHPRALQLVMDSLRYWVTEMHVDGFRFDLASTLARELYEVKQLSAFFTIIQQDPILSQVKLIAEPWDVGPGGYQVGNFPALWAEWNGKYRDTVRRFWRGDGGQVAELAYRLSGSSDLYQDDGRAPNASINFVTAHDGFTLRDLVSYNHKHNAANGEHNRDGTDQNDSWNCGVEGPSDDPAIVALRRRQVRNLLATLLLSQGVPMLLAGDECGHTQGGNNNAYSQDNHVSWLSWQFDAEAEALCEFTRQLITLRREHPVLHRRKFFQGRDIHGEAVRDIVWLRPDGHEMNEAEWRDGRVRSLGVLLNGTQISEPDERGQRIVDDTFLLLMNANGQPLPFQLPTLPSTRRWEVLIDTARTELRKLVAAMPQPYDLRERSLVLLIAR